MEESKYLEFQTVGNTGKTVIVDVLSRLHGFKLGTIKWFGKWRQYTFFPESNTLYNRVCLREIADYVSELTCARLGNARNGKN